VTNVLVGFAGSNMAEGALGGESPPRKVRAGFRRQREGLLLAKEPFEDFGEEPESDAR